MNTTPAIKVEDLSYIYSEGTPYQKTAIDNVNLEIEKGALVGVIGHTGSGKSTLIQHFNGLLKPTHGKVYINGQDMWADPAQIRKFRFQVGLVFQYPEYQLFEETVYKDIAFGPKNMGMSESEVDTAVRRSAEFVGLTADQLEKSPFELSGGQKRRVAIAGVIAMNPQVLILDEPTAGLDPKGRDTILGQIREYHREQGNTVLIVSHSMEDVAKYCKKALVVNDAKLFMYDDVEKVFAHSKELSEMGLSVPQISGIFMKLKALGYPVNDGVFTVEQAKAEMLRLLKEGEIDAMLKDITIGQYFPGTSVIHKMDPRMKIILTMAYIIMLFIASNFAGMAVGVVFLAAAYVVSKVPFKMITKSLKPVIPIVIFTAVLNIFFVDGDPIVQWGFFKITWQGVYTALIMSVRIICLIAGTSLMTYTTSPIALTDGIERLLKPLNKIKVPVHELAMMMTIALRFIPTLIEETDKIMSAQKARGADMESGGIMQRAKALIPVLIPLFVSAFRRADELALAMECRCYRGGEGRTRMKQLFMTSVDVWAAVITALTTAAIIALNILL